MFYGQNTKAICKASFQSIRNVSSVYRLLKFEMKQVHILVSPVFNKESIALKQTGNGHRTWCFDFLSSESSSSMIPRYFYFAYLKDKVYTFPMTSRDELKRTVINKIQQIILHTFQVVIENRCQEWIWFLDGKTVIWAFFINFDVTRRHSIMGILGKSSAIV